MKIINIYEAKTHFSKLLEQVDQGKEVIIGRAGKPIARLVPYREVKQRPKLGLLAGKISISDDFDDELPDDILDAFEGKTE